MFARFAQSAFKTAARNKASIGVAASAAAACYAMQKTQGRTFEMPALWQLRAGPLAEALAKDSCKASDDPYSRSRRNAPLPGSDHVILGGNANPKLSRKVASRLGTSLAEGTVGHFADGEVRCEFAAKDISGKHCYIVQPTCRPVNESLMEVVMMVSACRRAGAQSVTVVAPYYGYARQDRSIKGKATPISSGDVSQILEFMGASRIITVDLHSLQTTGMVTAKCQFEDYEGAFAGLSYFLDNIPDKDNLVVVSPDAGGMKRATSFHSHFAFHGHNNVGLAMISKERKAANEVGKVILIGDVQGKTCIVVDDMIDTAGTLCAAATVLKEKGANDVFAFATHGLFSGPAGDRIAKSQFTKVITTDSMPLTDDFKAKVGDKHGQVSLDLLLAEIIRRTHLGEDRTDLQKVPIY